MKLVLPAIATAALMLTACGDNNATKEGPVEGPAVSESEAPRNPPVDTGASAPLTPGANSFTEGQARSAIEKQGYTAIGPLSQDAQGIWSATATKDGAKTRVSVDYKGVVAAGTTAP